MGGVEGGFHVSCTEAKETFEAFRCRASLSQRPGQKKNTPMPRLT